MSRPSEPSLSPADPRPDAAAIFDRQAFLERLDIREDELGDLIKTYVRCMDECLDRLDAAIREKNHPAVRNCLHTVKGASGNLNMTEMQKLGIVFEATVDLNTWPVLAGHAARLRQALDRVRAFCPPEAGGPA